MNTNHVLLMLEDGARTAESNGEGGIARTLDAMADSLAESLRHQNDIGPWREADLRALWARTVDR